MKLWLVHRTDDIGYDEYDSCVVAAETEEEARLTHPCGDYVWMGKHGEWRKNDWTDRDWPAPGKLTVREIGTANEGEHGVIISSFNAG